MARLRRILARLRPQRRWLQISLRTLLVLFVIASIGLAIWGARWRRQVLHERAVQAIQEVGGVYRLAKDERVAPNREEGTARVYLAGKKMDDKMLADLAPHLRRLRVLTEIDLVQAPVTDQGVMNLQEVTRVEKIYLFETEVTDQGVKDLAKRMPSVEISRERPDPIASSLVSFNVYRHALVALAIHPDGRGFVTGSGGGELREWRLEGLSSSPPVRMHDNWLFAAAYSASSELLATGGGDNLIKLWRGEQREPQRVIRAATGDVHALAFSADGKWLYSAGDDMKLRRHAVDAPRESQVIGSTARQIASLAVHPVDDRVVTGSRDGLVTIWDPVECVALAKLDEHQADVMSVAFDNSGRLLASASYDGAVRIRDANTGRTLRTLTAHQGRVYTAVFSPDGATLASGAADGVLLWDARTGELLAENLDQPNVSRVAFTPGGSGLLAIDAQGAVRLLDGDYLSLVAKRDTARSARPDPRRSALPTIRRIGTTRLSRR